MAHTKFAVEILTPEGEVFNEEVEMISTRTTLGSIGILAGHAPLLATLEPCELHVYRSESEIVKFAQSEGYLQVAEGRAMLLVQDAVTPQSLDAEALRAQLSEAQQALANADAGSEAARQANREIKRAEAFLGVSSS